jgi:penicillin-binding protein 1A
MYITRIEDNTGNVICQFTQQAHEVMDDVSAKKMVYMMREVVRSGTGRRMNGICTVPMAGKTGTTNNNSDGWFVGYTPQLVSGAWVGGEDRSIHFDYTGMGQGASMALPIVGKFTNKCYADPSLGYDRSMQFDLDQDFMDNMKNSCSEYSAFDVENTEYEVAEEE